MSESAASGFRLASDAIALPKGAFARAHRERLRWRDQTVLALTQGGLRAYAYPLATPAGFCVAAEAPADHPHHSGFWVAADHVHAHWPAADGRTEEYTYNFYVDDTFQGRAPGRILAEGAVGRALGPERFEIVQALEWRGPTEWGAPEGRKVARETRTMTVTAGARAHRIDVVSRLCGADVALTLGPTRHAYFNVRVADSMIVANGGTVRDDRGRSSAAAVCGAGARWVDFTGPVGGGAVAGVTLAPHPVAGRAPFWFVADWGVVSVGPFREAGLSLAPGETFECGCAMLVHDGEPDLEDIARIAAA